MVHSETEGWVTVSSISRTYDLLQLKAENKEVILADIELKEGNCTQTRLDISSVVIVDSGESHEAKLPLGELKIVGNLILDSDTSSTVRFDFIVDESLHVTGNGKYIFAPVIQFENRTDADIEVNSDNSVEVTNGKVISNINVGMDIDGDVGVGSRIPSSANLGVGSNGQISIIKGSGIGIGL